MVDPQDLEKFAGPEDPFVPEKNSLLKKYDIPLSFLDFEHVEKCQNVRELEKIVHILRSGQEGYYPDLLQRTEEKLMELKPTSKYLKKMTPLISKKNLNQEEKDILDKDFGDWLDEIQKTNKEIKRSKKFPSQAYLPEVRTPKELVTNADKTETVKRIKSTDYQSWDKYDPDTELLKLDLKEERLKKENEKQQKEAPKKKVVRINEFKTRAEAIYEANCEREKGNEFFKAGDIQEALSHYTNSINCHPSAAAYTNRGLTYIKLKKYNEAICDCKKALNYDPKSIKAYLRIAISYECLKKYDDAMDYVEEAIYLEPNNVAAQELAARIRDKIVPVFRTNTRMKIVELEDEDNENGKVDERNEFNKCGDVNENNGLTEYKKKQGENYEVITKTNNNTNAKISTNDKGVTNNKFVTKTNNNYASKTLSNTATKTNNFESGRNDCFAAKSSKDKNELECFDSSESSDDSLSSFDELDGINLNEILKNNTKSINENNIKFESYNNKGNNMTKTQEKRNNREPDCEKDKLDRDNVKNTTIYSSKVCKNSENIGRKPLGIFDNKQKKLGFDLKGDLQSNYKSTSRSLEIVQLNRDVNRNRGLDRNKEVDCNKEVDRSRKDRSIRQLSPPPKKSILKKTPTILPVPGTSRMPPPFYITVPSNDPRDIKNGMKEVNMRVLQRAMFMPMIHLLPDDEDDELLNEAEDKPKVVIYSKQQQKKYVKKGVHKPRTVNIENEDKQQNQKTIIESKDDLKNVNENDSNTPINKLTNIRQPETKLLHLREEMESSSKAVPILENNDNKKFTENIINTKNGEVLKHCEQSKKNGHLVLSTKTPANDKGGSGEPFIIAQPPDSATPQELLSPYTFLRVWNSSNRDTTYTKQAEILRSIDLGHLSDVIGCKLDSSMLSGIIHSLYRHFSVASELEKVRSALLNLATMPRINIMILFMSKEDKIATQNLIEFLDQHDKSLPDNIRKLYLS